MTTVGVIDMTVKMILMTAGACPGDMGHFGYLTEGSEEEHYVLLINKALLPLSSARSFCAAINFCRSKRSILLPVQEFFKKETSTAIMEAGAS